MKVALVYDRVNKWGGAERVLLALHRLFPDAPLYTSVYNKKTAPWANIFDVRTSFLQKIPFATTFHEFFPLLMPVAFEQFRFDEYDVVISVTSESAKGIITGPRTKHICYCLTPTRYLWSGYDMYFQNALFRTLSKPAVSYMRNWDIMASSRPDAYISISHEVQERVTEYYRRDSEVVHPAFDLRSVVSDHHVAEEDYLLVVSRLVPYKRVDLAIQACNKLKIPLVIIGTGSEEKRLKMMAGPTVKFLGNLTDEQLVAYYRHCRAFLFPGIEDFGLTMVEAQSFGKPVIAYKAGGALDIIQSERTGIFFHTQTARSLRAAIEKLSAVKFSEDVIRTNAERFSTKTFELLFMQEVERILA